MMTWIRRRRWLRNLQPGNRVEIWLIDWISGGWDGFYPARVISTRGRNATIEIDVPGAGAHVTSGRAFLGTRRDPQIITVPRMRLHPAGSGQPLVTSFGG